MRRRPPWPGLILLPLPDLFTATIQTPPWSGGYVQHAAKGAQMYCHALDRGLVPSPRPGLSISRRPLVSRLHLHANMQTNAELCSDSLVPFLTIFSVLPAEVLIFRHQPSSPAQLTQLTSPLAT